MQQAHSMCQNSSKLHHEVMEHRFVRYCIDWLFRSPNDPDMQSWVPHFIDKWDVPQTAAHHRASALRHHIFTAMAAGMKASDSPEVQHVRGGRRRPVICARPRHARWRPAPRGERGRRSRDLADYGITVASDGVGVDAVHLRRGGNHAVTAANTICSALFAAQAQNG